MKFIVDAQLPKSLSDFLCSKGDDSLHTLEVPNKNATKDSSLISLSTNENRVVITKDSDFLEYFIINSQPQKLILVKTGNIKNNILIGIFELHLDKITSLLKQNALIEINKSEISSTRLIRN